MPSGSQPIEITSAPSSHNTLGATWYAAPFAQSITIFKFFRENLSGNVDLTNSKYLPAASSILFALPSFVESTRLDG